MIDYLLVIPVLLPLAAGGIMLLSPAKNRKLFLWSAETVVVINSILVWALLLTGTGRENGVVLLHLSPELKVILRPDGTGSVFAGLVAFLWPLAMLYAFEYMEHDIRQRSFFAFYVMTYGVTLGIALSGSLLSLYLFYEMLTLVTFPLVLHYRDADSRKAARKYLYYSIGGAAFGFLGLVFVLSVGGSSDFVQGGVPALREAVESRDLLLLIYVLAFAGFGVKAALFPVQKWLPSASVAPTPVTALLHAVAVVKAGAFAIIRLTYFSFGPDMLRGTWAQYTVGGLALFTIAYGSTMACKEIHFKKRLAYSTIANLSYVLMGCCMMSEAGLFAALSHLVIHAIMKICAFFCAGAVMHKADRHHVYELNGLGRRMPVTFACFTIAGLSLTGMPLFAGFISKWNLAMAALTEGTVFGIIAVCVLLYSALMTGIYMMTVVVRAYFPGRGFDYNTLKEIRDPTWRMLLPIGLFAALLILLGVWSGPLMNFLTAVAKGVL
ncbi:MAG: proton-conducting membrane transporter [Lachnospiraceae bacterium]|nr:proton-conducting membrane transporter [Lachnospiraceae bacterium]